MTKKQKAKSSRRKFLKLGLTAGAATIAGVGIMTTASKGKTKDSGEKVKLLNTEGKLVEVDKSHVQEPGHSHSQLSKEEVRIGMLGKRFIMVIDLSKCRNARKCVESCQKHHNLRSDEEYIKVFLMRESEDTAPYWFPKPCFHCGKPLQASSYRGCLLLTGPGPAGDAAMPVGPSDYCRVVRPNQPRRPEVLAC